MRNNYLVFRDSLRAIDAASSRLNRDIRTASGALLLSRARAVRNACSNALRTVDSARQDLLGSPYAVRSPQRARDDVSKAQGELRLALTHCVTQFDEYSDPAKATAVRDIGTQSVSDAVTVGKKFERAAEAFLGTLGITVRPYGAGDAPNPFAGRSN